MSYYDEETYKYLRSEFKLPATRTLRGMMDPVRKPTIARLEAKKAALEAARTAREDNRRRREQEQARVFYERQRALAKARKERLAAAAAAKENTAVEPPQSQISVVCIENVQTTTPTDEGAAASTSVVDLQLDFDPAQESSSSENPPPPKTEASVAEEKEEEFLINTPYHLHEDPHDGSGALKTEEEDDILRQALQTIESEAGPPESGGASAAEADAENNATVDLVSAGIISMEFDKELEEVQKQMGD